MDDGVMAGILHIEGAEAIAPDLSNLMRIITAGCGPLGLYGHGLMLLLMVCLLLPAALIKGRLTGQGKGWCGLVMNWASCWICPSNEKGFGISPASATALWWRPILMFMFIRITAQSDRPAIASHCRIRRFGGA